MRDGEVVVREQGKGGHLLRGKIFFLSRKKIIKNHNQVCFIKANFTLEEEESRW